MERSKTAPADIQRYRLVTRSATPVRCESPVKINYPAMFEPQRAEVKEDTLVVFRKQLSLPYRRKTRKHNKIPDRDVIPNNIVLKNLWINDNANIGIVHDESVMNVEV